MKEQLNYILFGLYPYIALVVFVVGSIARFKYSQYTWRSSSSQLLRNKGMRIGNNLFHIGIILLFFGHFIGMLTPESIYHIFITSAQKQLLAMIAGGIFGTITFIGMSMLVYRRLFDDRIRANSSFSDIAILLLLYVQLILGLMTIAFSTQHLDGHNMVMLANWAQHIVTLRPGAEHFILDQGIVFKAHILFVPNSANAVHKFLISLTEI